MMIYPLAICGACVVTSILGTYFVKLGKSNSIMGALYKGFIATAVLSLIILFFITDLVVGFGTTLSIADKSFNGFDLYLWRDGISYNWTNYMDY